MITDQSSKSVSLETALNRLPSSSVTSFGDAKTLNSLSSTISSSEGSTEISSFGDDSVCIPTESSYSNDSASCQKIDGLIHNELLQTKIAHDVSSVMTPPNLQVRVGIRVRPNPPNSRRNVTTNIL